METTIAQKDSLVIKTKNNINKLVNQQLNKVSVLMETQAEEGGFKLSYYLINVNPKELNNLVVDKMVDFLTVKGYNVEKEYLFLNIFRVKISWGD